MWGRVQQQQRMQQVIIIELLMPILLYANDYFNLRPRQVINAG